MIPREMIDRAVEARQESNRLIRKWTTKSDSALPRVVHLLDRVSRLESSADVSSLLVNWSGSDSADTEVYLYLDPERCDSRLVRELAREFHLTLSKEKNYTREALNAEAIVDRIRLVVSGYKPETCRIVEETVDVPASVKTVRRIICDGVDK